MAHKVGDVDNRGSDPDECSRGYLHPAARVNPYIEDEGPTIYLRPMKSYNIFLLWIDWYHT